MPLPEDFQFSQSSLQDYVDCPRRFQLRYIQRLNWPAVEAAPVLENERRIQLGDCFHHLVQQHLTGIPPERLSGMAPAAAADGELLCCWWENYLNCLRESGSLERLSHARILHFPEISLSAPFCGHRLIAKYDALTISTIGGGGSGQSSPDPLAVIFDWKTTPKRTSRTILAGRMQSRVYPYLLVRAGEAFLKERPIQPEQVEMVYWFAGFPDQPERFPYSQEQYRQDGEYLAELAGRINACGDADFPMGEGGRGCLYCTYRSLCDRGVCAADVDEADESLPSGGEAGIFSDLEQVQEVAF